MSGMTRRKFLKRTGGASVAAIVGINLALQTNYANADPEEEVPLNASYKLKLDTIGPVNPNSDFTEFSFWDRLDQRVDAKIVVAISTGWDFSYPWPGDYSYIEYWYNIEYDVFYKNGPNWVGVQDASWTVHCKGKAWLVNGGPAVDTSGVVPSFQEALEGQPDLKFEFEGKEYEASISFGVVAGDGATMCVAGMSVSLPDDGPVKAAVPSNPPEDEPVKLGHAWSSEKK